MSTIIKEKPVLKQIVESLAQRIYDENGEVLPSALVERAKNKNEPAHAAFEWNNDKAGHEHRLAQARKWLRIIVIRTTDASQPERLVHVPTIIRDVTQEGTYKPLSIVGNNINEFDRALIESITRLRAAELSVNELLSVAKRVGGSKRAAKILQLVKAMSVITKTIRTI